MYGHLSRKSTYIYVASQILRFTTQPQLTPHEVTTILRENEHSQIFSDSPIKGYDSNQLRSNKPIEDSRTEASLIDNKGFLCGIYDGHAGPSCSQVISKRLLRYLSASLIDRKLLKNEITKGTAFSQSFLKCHNDKVDFVKDIRDVYEESFQGYIKYLLTQADNQPVSEVLENAFVKLDDDLSREALEYENPKTFAVAMSGAVAIVAFIKDQDVYIASTGDCGAVMGSYSDTGQWVTKPLTHDHNSDNLKEVNRILSEHPPNERETVIRNDRLLGQLAPLRALGDFRYKWSNEIMQNFVVPLYGANSIPLYYQTPPYLTARPDITHHKLSSNDRFLVIASDGLWDFLSPTEVVSLVGEHITGKKFIEPLELDENNNVSFGEILDNLTKRKAGRKHKPTDQNSATHLIRTALGGTEYGIEHSKLSYFLTLPQDVVRQYRDDITITVIYFNSDYIKKKFESTHTKE